MTLLLDSSKLSDVTYLGSSTVGMKGMGIDYDGYSFKGGDFEFSAALSKVSGSDNMCYPVLENVKLRKHHRNHVMIMYKAQRVFILQSVKKYLETQYFLTLFRKTSE